jgi:hypothetical protein
MLLGIDPIFPGISKRAIVLKNTSLASVGWFIGASPGEGRNSSVLRSRSGLSTLNGPIKVGKDHQLSVSFAVKLGESYRNVL